MIAKTVNNSGYLGSAATKLFCSCTTLKFVPDEWTKMVRDVEKWVMLDKQHHHFCLCSNRWVDILVRWLFSEELVDSQVSWIYDIQSWIKLYVLNFSCNQNMCAKRKLSIKLTFTMFMGRYVFIRRDVKLHIIYTSMHAWYINIAWRTMKFIQMIRHRGRALLNKRIFLLIFCRIFCLPLWFLCRLCHYFRSAIVDLLC